jgi:hypothetical protein
VLFLLLNPSTADANVLDPTLRRCMSFAEAWGYGGILVGNIFALRSTDPQFLYLSRDPIGPTNDFYIKTMVELVDQVVCGWGAHGALYEPRGRGRQEPGRQSVVFRLDEARLPEAPPLPQKRNGACALWMRS